MQPSITTIKRLFTLSDNRCTFDKCLTPLVEDESGAVVGEICHIKATRAGGPRYDPNQTDEDRHGFANLILLCPTHHKIIDSDAGKYTVEYLQRMKASSNRAANKEILPSDAKKAERILRQYLLRIDGSLTTGDIHAQTVVFNGPKSARPKVSFPVDVVGGSSSHRSYTAHLIKRYQTFASSQRGRTFKYPVIHPAIEREFGTGWQWVPLGRFDEFAIFLQNKIDNTLVGKQNKSKGRPNYSQFSEYCLKYRTAKESSDRTK